MTTNEFGHECDKCHQKGGSTFARTYYKQIDGKWMKLCSSCWEIVEFLEKLDLGLFEEYMLISFIEKYLVSKKEKEGLRKNKLTIEEILNGRFLYTDKKEEFINSMFSAWNTKLGREMFIRY